MEKQKLIAELVFEWCEKKWGSPLKTKKCELIVSFDRRVKNFTGYYLDRTIKVFPLNCLTKKELIKTVLHEYCHFLQMPSLSDSRYYSQMDKSLGYDKNPYEVQARLFEKKYYKKCKKYIDKKLLK